MWYTVKDLHGLGVHLQHRTGHPHRPPTTRTGASSGDASSSSFSSDSLDEDDDDESDEAEEADEEREVSLQLGPSDHSNTSSEPEEESMWSSMMLT